MAMVPSRTRSQRNLRRVAAAAAVTLASVAVLVLAPGATSAYAANLMGPLRTPGEPAFIAAHRGDRSSAPENTVAAFDAALSTGTAFIETDVRITADGHPILMHDLTVDQIRTLDAGSWFAPEFAGEQVPLWGEFLDVVVGAPKVTALVELKGVWTVANVETLMSGIYFRGLQDRIVFASFSSITVERLQEVAPLLPRVLLRRVLPLDPVAVAQRYGAIAIMTRSSALQARPDAVELMHAAGLGLLLYTLNSEDRWGEALAYGVDGIITDRPSALDAWIAQTAPGT